MFDSSVSVGADLLRHGVQEVHEHQGGARAAQHTEPLLVDPDDLVGPVETGERPVHDVAEGRVSASEHEPVGFIRELLVDERELLGVLGSDEEADEQDSEEHTSELQSHSDLVCRLLLEKKKKKKD